MSERGVFAVDRGIWEHDLLTDSEPFSRREAWLWLVSEAAWKPHRRRVIGRIFDLERGQLVASNRFIASKWRWSEARVRRFLGALISERMIDSKTDAGVNVITVCKYTEYQRVSLPIDAMRESDVDAGATQERRKVEDKEDIELDGGGERARDSKPLISKVALEFSMELAVIAGHDREILPPRWLSDGPAYRVQMMLDAGYQIETMRDLAKSTIAKKRDGPPATIKYFEPIFARAHAAQAPLPVVVVSGEAKTITIQGGHSGGIREDRSISRAAGRLAEQGFSFGPRPSLVAAEPGADVIRLLPERRSG